MKKKSRQKKTLAGDYLAGLDLPPFEKEKQAKENISKRFYKSCRIWFVFDLTNNAVGNMA